MVKSSFDYSVAKSELQDIVEWFEQGEPDLDMALKKFKRAEELIAQIEAYLKDMETQLKITVHKSTK